MLLITPIVYRGAAKADALLGRAISTSTGLRAGFGRLPLSYPVDRDLWQVMGYLLTGKTMQADGQTAAEYTEVEQRSVADFTRLQSLTQKQTTTR